MLCQAVAHTERVAHKAAQHEHNPLKMGRPMPMEIPMHRYLPHIAALVIFVAIVFVATQYQIVQWGAEQEVEQSH